MIPNWIAPVPDQLSEAFWSAARDRQLLLQRCKTTGRYQWFPRGMSLHHPGGEVEWVPSSGRGTAFSVTHVHRSYGPTAEKVQNPYQVVLVELEEGVMVLSRIAEDETASIDVGMQVEVAFERVNDEISLPVFRRPGTGP